MKKLLITLFAVLMTLSLSAQIEKGTVLLGISSSVNVAESGSNLMSLGFTSSTFKTDMEGFSDADPDKITRFNLAPHLGIFAADNLVIGVDLVYGYYRYKEPEDTFYPFNYKETLICTGPFVRYYVPLKRVLPFVEAGVTFGSNVSKTERPSDSTVGDTEDKTNIMTYSAGVGLAAPLGERVNFDIMAGYRFLQFKYDDNEYDSRSEYSTVGLTLGFTVLLGGSN